MTQLFVRRRFATEKVVRYMGQDFLVPVSTVYMALERYGDSDDAMVIAFTSPVAPTRTVIGTWASLSQKCVAIVTPPVDYDVSKSLVKVD